MPRTTYKTRLEALINNPAITNSDYRFAKSLLESYLKAKSLTAGRRAWLVKLEEKYSEAAVAARKEAGKAFAGRIGELRTTLGRIPASERWETQFMTSIVGQLENGRQLSPKQEGLIEKVTSKYTDEKIATGRVFAAEFKEKHEAKFRIACEYYSRVGYFRTIVERAADPEYIPTEQEFEKVTANKYAEKVIAEYTKEAKYAAGGMISFRSNAQRIKEYTKKKSFAQQQAQGNPQWHAPFRGGYAGSQAQNSGKYITGRLPNQIANGMAIILNDNAIVPISACKGGRVYSVLPIGATEPVLIEERYLKNPPKKAR